MSAAILPPVFKCLLAMYIKVVSLYINFDIPITYKICQILFNICQLIEIKNTGVMRSMWVGQLKTHYNIS